MVETNEDDLPTVELDIDRELVDAYVESVGHRIEPGRADREVPPSIAGVIVYGLVSRVQPTVGVVLVGQGYEMHRAIRVGDHLTTSGFTQRFEDHKGRPSMLIRTRTVNDEGQLVMTASVRRLLPGGAA